jgi:hypothetical protein
MAPFIGPTSCLVAAHDRVDVRRIEEALLGEQRLECFDAQREVRLIVVAVVAHAPDPARDRLEAVEVHAGAGSALSPQSSRASKRTA